MGGLFVGRTYSLPYKTKFRYDYVTFITDSIQSFEYKNSSVSLSMEINIWNGTIKYLDEGKVVLGWYHSHPNIGAFFSTTDGRRNKLLLIIHFL